jgi:TetR/AcrR family transcriptional regulator, regulator of autoinduction and epiphytic fitness
MVMSAAAAVAASSISPRARRARALIADALLELIREGDLRATAPRIAARAGVSLRTVFHHFPDLEALHQAVGERQVARIAELLAPIDPSWPLDLRIERFTGQRARVYELIAPVRRAALLHEPLSPAVAHSLAQVRAQKRAHALASFAPELRAAPAATRRTLAAALAALASFSTWDALRRQQGLAVPAARRALALSLTRLLDGGRP